MRYPEGPFVHRARGVANAEAVGMELASTPVHGRRRSRPVARCTRGPSGYLRMTFPPRVAPVSHSALRDPSCPFVPLRAPSCPFVPLRGQPVLVVQPLFPRQVVEPPLA